MNEDGKVSVGRLLTVPGGAPKPPICWAIRRLNRSMVKRKVPGCGRVG